MKQRHLDATIAAYHSTLTIDIFGEGSEQDRLELELSKSIVSAFHCDYIDWMATLRCLSLLTTDES